MNIPDEPLRNVYAKECVKSAWSVRQLEWQIRIDEFLQLEDEDENEE